MELTGAQIILECLKKEKVDIVFGYPGGSVIPLFDAIYQQDEINLILPRHEQAGGHGADGYARASGKVGVVIATSGPGATNLVTALATAYLDSIPIVAFTGQVKSHLIGTDAFQEADITGITRPVTKHNYLVKDVKELTKIIKEAFYVASSGRPGPVLIDIPADVTTSKCDFEYPDSISMKNYNPTYEGHMGQIKKALSLIEKAEKPIIIVGGGVVSSGAYEEMRNFVKKSNIPITSTLMGLGVIDSNDKLFLGMLGMHGTAYANLAVSNCDLLINIGGRFDDRVTGNTSEFSKNAKIIHVDIDPTSIGKLVKTHLPIVGDAKYVLKKLTEKIKKRDYENWHKEILDWKKKFPLEKYDMKLDDEKIKPYDIVHAINKITENKKTIFVTEVGQHQMWSAQYLKLSRPRQLVTSGGLGTMGFGFPAGIGAQLSDPESLTVVLAGDGSFQMNLQELATVRNYGIPLKIVIFNNGYLGMVRQWQEMFFNKHYSSTCLSRDKTCPRVCDGKECLKYVPNFIDLAKAYNINGYCITKKSELEKELKKALIDDSGPALIEVKMDRFENVMPMVPAGVGINNFIYKYEKN